MWVLKFCLWVQLHLVGGAYAGGWEQSFYWLVWPAAPATSSASHPLLPCAVLPGEPVALETFPISNELRYISFATACRTFTTTTTQVMNYNTLLGQMHVWQFIYQCNIFQICFWWKLHITKYKYICESVFVHLFFYVCIYPLWDCSDSVTDGHIKVFTGLEVSLWRRLVVKLLWDKQEGFLRRCRSGASTLS